MGDGGGGKGDTCSAGGGYLALPLARAFSSLHLAGPLPVATCQALLFETFSLVFFFSLLSCPALGRSETSAAAGRYTNTLAMSAAQRRAAQRRNLPPEDTRTHTHIHTHTHTLTHAYTHSLTHTYMPVHVRSTHSIHHRHAWTRSTSSLNTRYSCVAAPRESIHLHSVMYIHACSIQQRPRPARRRRPECFVCAGPYVQPARGGGC